MKILLIGASGYVGARLYYDLSGTYSVIGTYAAHKLSEKFEYLDITDSEATQNYIVRTRPDIIIHAANQADPRWCEANPQKAVLLNQMATTYLVDAANSVHARFIYISSFAAYKPVGIYAETKVESEKTTRNVKAGYLIIRPAYILGYSPNTTNDRAFNRLLKNLDKGTPAIYDTSWKVQPTYIRNISEVISLCIKRGIWNDIIPITADTPISRFEAARDILAPFGVAVSPIDNHDTTPAIHIDQSKLLEYDFPIYTYAQMIDAIIDEIKQRHKFTL
ncbi:sugar nucleotide-binding protein [Candidatus Woesebacteria bacterium]|nr:sugar nucleotide-binding protein [Candidatus Woesebacteria bacterium]